MVYTTSPFYPLFLPIPHLAAPQLPSPKHSLINFVEYLITSPQISNNFMFLFPCSYPVRIEKVLDWINEADAPTFNIPWQLPPRFQPREVTLLRYQKESKQLTGARGKSRALLDCFLSCFTWSLTAPQNLPQYSFLPTCLGRRVPSENGHRRLQGRAGGLTYFRIKWCWLAGGSK